MGICPYVSRTAKSNLVGAFENIYSLFKQVHDFSSWILQGQMKWFFLNVFQTQFWRIAHSLINIREVLILTLVHPKGWINDERMWVHCIELGYIGLYIGFVLGTYPAPSRFPRPWRFYWASVNISVVGVVQCTMYNPIHPSTLEGGLLS